ncbi:sugar-binding transcriptional regulator, LacI family [Enterococcus faecalis NY9]|nr:sugar-binding transcriptional regulator, LacI family [Enterococcus faecalis NY9]
MKKITITDISKLVGVSKATISHYLNGNYKKMSFETRKKIEKVISETEYEPSPIAKSLVTKDTKTIGVVIADITNPFISAVMKGIHDTCKKLDYTVTFTNSDNDEEIEAENIKRLMQQNVSGIIIDSVDANGKNLEMLNNENIIMIDRQSSTLKIDTVVSNNKSSTQKFIQYMKEANCSNFYFVSYPIEGVSTREKRFEGFELEVPDAKKRCVILQQPNTQEKILNLIAKNRGNISFFTMNGPALLDFMKIMNQTTYTYPKDFSLGSYEDLEWMEVLNPNVSCIKQNSYKIGEVAVTHLVEKLTKQEKLKKVKLLIVPNEIVIRNSF